MRFIWLNVGSGTEISIKELASLISKLVGYEGDIVWDESIPDGTPRKILDISKIKSLGWEPKTKLEEGLKIAINDFKKVVKKCWLKNILDLNFMNLWI